MGAFNTINVSFNYGIVHFCPRAKQIIEWPPLDQIAWCHWLESDKIGLLGAYQ